MNKVPGSNLTGQSARLMNPTSLRLPVTFKSKLRKCSVSHQVSEVVSSIMGQSWLWDSHRADKIARIWLTLTQLKSVDSQILMGG